MKKARKYINTLMKLRMLHHGTADSKVKVLTSTFTLP